MTLYLGYLFWDDMITTILLSSMLINLATYSSQHYRLYVLTSLAGTCWWDWHLFSLHCDSTSFHLATVYDKFRWLKIKQRKLLKMYIITPQKQFTDAQIIIQIPCNVRYSKDWIILPAMTQNHQNTERHLADNNILLLNDSLKLIEIRYIRKGSFFSTV